MLKGLLAARTRARILFSLALLALLSSLSVSASARSQPLSVSGRVLDQNSAAGAGAAVTLRRDSTSFERAATTDAGGLNRRF